MKTNHEYQPEDIEALLAEKSFAQLYEEEKRFVLEHLASAEEYERMREMLLAIRGAAGEDESSGAYRPSERVKRELMEEFSREQRRRRALWWNSVGFLFRNRLRFDLPVVRIGFAAVLLLLGVWTVFRFTGNHSDPVIAEKKKTAPPVIFLQPQAPAHPLVNQPAPQPAPDAPKKIQPANHEAIAKKNDLLVSKQFSGQQVYEQTNTHLAVNDLKTAKTDTAAQIVATVNGNSGNVLFDMDNPSDSATVPIVTLSNATTTICNGATSTITSTGGTTFSWSPAATYSSSPTAAGSYTVTVTDASASNYSTINITPVRPRTRSLAADAGIISAFYELK